jgi:hypothetical protein
LIMRQRSLNRRRPLGPAVDPIAYAPGLKELSVVFFPVGLIAEHLALLPVQQLRQDIAGFTCFIRMK